MDETMFEVDTAQLAEASRRFPAHRRAVTVGHPGVGLAHLTASGSEFGRHAWDEGGHF